MKIMVSKYLESQLEAQIVGTIDERWSENNREYESHGNVDCIKESNCGTYISLLTEKCRGVCQARLTVMRSLCIRGPSFAEYVHVDNLAHVLDPDSYYSIIIAS